MTTQALINLLEISPEGNRQLDAAIAVNTFNTAAKDDDLIYASMVRSYDNCASGTYWRVSRSGRSLQTAPPYTTSLDAALTLVPKGFTRAVDATVLEAGIDVDLYPPTIADYASLAAVKMRVENEITGTHRSEPLATCIAALKARAAS